MGMGERGISFTISAYDKFSRPIDEFSAKMAQSTAGLRRFGTSMKGLGISSGLSGVTQSFGEVTSRGMAFGSKLALIGGGVGYGFKKGFLDVASQFEDFQIILNNLNRGDLAKSKKEMSWISDFAAKTPYELAEVTDSFVKLRSYGLEPMNGLLTTLGDTSSSMGKPLSQAVEAIADAVTGENERLKEFGITANKVGQKIVYNYTDSTGKQSKMMVQAGDRAAIQATLMKIWAEKFSGGMEARSKGWKGMMSNLSDAWSRFANMAMSNSAFDFLKNKLQGLLDTIDQMSKDGSLDALAKQWGENITSGLKDAWEAAKGVASAFLAIGAALTIASTAVGGWDNLARIAVGFMAAEFIVSVVKLSQAFMVLGTAATATPLGMLAVAFGLIALNFATTNDVLTGLCQTVSLLAVAWGVLSAVFYASPIGLTVAALGLVAFAIQKVIQYWDALMNAFKTIAPDWVLRLMGINPGSGANASGRDGSSPGAARDFAKGFGQLPSFDGPPASRPKFGAAGLQQRIEESRSSFNTTQESKITVDFSNTPKGTTINALGAPVDLGVNWTMGPAMAD